LPQVLFVKTLLKRWLLRVPINVEAKSLTKY
jgi:hypothetical protein